MHCPCFVHTCYIKRPHYSNSQSNFSNHTSCVGNFKRSFLFYLTLMSVTRRTYSVRNLNNHSSKFYFNINNFNNIRKVGYEIFRHYHKVNWEFHRTKTLYNQVALPVRAIKFFRIPFSLCCNCSRERLERPVVISLPKVKSYGLSRAALFIKKILVRHLCSQYRFRWQWGCA